MKGLVAALMAKISFMMTTLLGILKTLRELCSLHLESMNGIITCSLTLGTIPNVVIICFSTPCSKKGATKLMVVIRQISTDLQFFSPLERERNFQKKFIYYFSPLHIWHGMDQSIIDKSIYEWSGRLRTCVRANVGQFEQLL